MTTLMAGLFGEKTKAKNQNSTYSLSTSVSKSNIWHCACRRRNDNPLSSLRFSFQQPQFAEENKSLKLIFLLTISYCVISIIFLFPCSFFGPTPTLEQQDWQIYVDQSKASLDRGGGAVFDAFFSLCDFDDDGQGALEVQVIPAILPKPASGGKGPWIRCIWNNNNRKNLARPSPNLDVSNVDSVDKVYRVLTKHLGMKVGKT
jgi:hypothetical protein